MSCETFIQSVSARLPELATVNDLINVGIYKTTQAAYGARLKGKGPPYLVIPFRGIVYPRSGVIEFLRKASNEKKERK